MVSLDLHFLSSFGLVCCVWKCGFWHNIAHHQQPCELRSASSSLVNLKTVAKQAYQGSSKPQMPTQAVLQVVWQMGGHGDTGQIWPDLHGAPSPQGIESPPSSSAGPQLNNGVCSP